MKFKLTATGHYYDPNRESDKISLLTSLGFNFEKAGDGSLLFLKDESEVEINTIEELIDFCYAVGGYIIFSGDAIEIYNDYV